MLLIDSITKMTLVVGDASKMFIPTGYRPIRRDDIENLKQQIMLITSIRR